ncbi:helix-turn-helix transcriptional regulator [Bradyrhizobium sp. ISRA443]|uniref:helix-turn-helix domain-containing protein n=1 Tax=unclassified Bradyrhizobium TaxID=2631580 RepID=UPI002478AC8F|nr:MULTISPECIES: helix-turn-helix transcriptional regulator [unclassified Bradyrhizobium]WGR93367.1 helix-turn-helix transcriptional regulator [Bradyrhizobium sp. ISRA435]WGR97902.1 helix-turn-helix transcriptional regulator [Bradyrhizobium sp. ISRA436]WGS04792.1 helix-turn-helix transcriptional regulator [Bradyrhizobium sp. ISRA437]WGS11673.1 helix-turn-helix transcriptional regulator [Bradyrhizobium sp. ISRA443]
MRARALVAWNVLRIRGERGIPQEQLAYDAGVDRSHMNGIELQKKNPTIDLLERVAETLGVHMSELFVEPPEGATPPKPLPKGRKRMRSNRRK